MMNKRWEEEIIIDIIKERMSNLNMSIYRLHKKTDISQSNLSRYLNGKVGMSLTSFLKIIHAINYEMDLYPRVYTNEDI